MIRQVTVVLQIEVDDRRNYAYSGCAQHQLLIIVPNLPTVITGVSEASRGGALPSGKPSWRHRFLVWGRRLLRVLWRFGPLLLGNCT